MIKPISPAGIKNPDPVAAGWGLNSFVCSPSKINKRYMIVEFCPARTKLGYECDSINQSDFHKGLIQKKRSISMNARYSIRFTASTHDVGLSHDKLTKLTIGPKPWHFRHAVKSILFGMYAGRLSAADRDFIETIDQDYVDINDTLSARQLSRLAGILIQNGYSPVFVGGGE